MLLLFYFLPTIILHLGNSLIKPRCGREVIFVAKDGTSRGNKPGNYTRAGRKPKPLAEQIVEGRKGITVIALPEPEKLTGFEIPPKEYMTAISKPILRRARSARTCCIRSGWRRRP